MAVNLKKIAANAARRNGIPVQAFLRQINAESGWRTNVTSPAGAVGVAQIVPKWHPGVNPRDPVASLNYAANHMGKTFKKYGNLRDALAVYNSGRPWSKAQNFAETRNYVKKILGGTNPTPGQVGQAMAAGGNAAGNAVAAASVRNLPAPQPLQVPQAQLHPKAIKSLRGFMERSNKLMAQGRFDDQQRMFAKYFEGMRKYAPQLQTNTPGVNVQAPPGGYGAQPQRGQMYSQAAAAGGRPTGRGFTPGGGWGGSEGVIKSLVGPSVKAQGLRVTSAKRDNKNPASGNRSDHHIGNKNAFAWDISNGNNPTPQMDAAASDIVRRLGGPANWGKRGGNFTTTRNGYRFQVIYRSQVGGNHNNHIHIGTSRL